MTNLTWMIAGIAFAAGIAQLIIARYYVYREDRPYHKDDPTVMTETMRRRKEIADDGYHETQKALSLSRTH
jgi:hypothetical protein